MSTGKQKLNTVIQNFGNFMVLFAKYNYCLEKTFKEPRSSCVIWLRIKRHIIGVYNHYMTITSHVV
eukprot:UN16980